MVRFEDPINDREHFPKLLQNELTSYSYENFFFDVKNWQTSFFFFHNHSFSFSIKGHRLFHQNQYSAQEMAIIRFQICTLAGK